MEPDITQGDFEIQDRLDILPYEIMDLIDSDLFEAVMIEQQESHSLSDDQIRLLENETILVLTFFSPREEFTDNVAESLAIEHSLAEVIGAEVQTDIFEMVEDIFVAVETERVKNQTPKENQKTLDINPKKAELKKLADTFGKAPQIPIAPVIQVPLVEPVFTDDVIPLHTMEGDIQKIHGYGAYVEKKEAGELPK